MTTYQRETDNLATLCQTQGKTWQSINPEYASRMRLQNRFRTGSRHCSIHCRHYACRHGSL